jgi:hypothetical protein
MWTQKITVASVIKKKVKMRGSYQQTSVENAQVDLIQSQLTISKSTTLLQIAKQQELFRLKKTRVVRQQILMMVMVSMIKFLLISSTWPVVVEMVTPNW